MAAIKFYVAGILTVCVARFAQATNSGSCTFTISSSGGISCPAGQLDDGQIRLNGSYPTAEFTIRGDKIWDSSQRGCIVTDAPITQVQCDLNKEPMPGFSIDSSNKLSYYGSSQFYACPATDTEYNIYIKPNFGQTKCIPVTLTASDCGAPPSHTSCPAAPPAPTVTETTTCTVTKTYAVTSWATSVGTVITTLPCTTTAWNTTTSKVCNKCQSKTTRKTSTTTGTSCTTSTTSSYCHKCMGSGKYTTSTTWATKWNH